MTGALERISHGLDGERWDEFRFVPERWVEGDGVVLMWRAAGLEPERDR